MKVPQISDTTNVLRRMPAIAMFATVIGGVLSLCGWQFGIAFLRSPFPNSSYITPLGGLAFVLSGLALWQFTGWVPRVARAVSRLCAAAVALYGTFTVVEYLLNVDLVPHGEFLATQLEREWTLPGPVGRIALNTAIAFAAFGFATLMPRVKIAGHLLREVFASVVLLLSLMTMIGYAYKVVAFSGFGSDVKMALYGALLFQTLGFGAFFADCRRGSARLITAHDAGGLVARRLLAGTVASLSLLGWVRVQFERGASYDTETGTAALVVGAVVVVSIFTLRTARLVSRMDTARRESEERTRLATRAADMGVWVWDVTAGLVFWDEKSRELFGWTGTEVISYETFLLHLHEDERERVRANAARPNSGGGEYDNQYRIVRGDGEVRWVAVRGRRFERADGNVQVFGVIWDVTDVRRTQDALVRGEKLASVGRMAATIAHEINNPLEAVMNLVYLCSSDARTPHDVREYLGTAEQELRRVAHLVRQTLGFYRETAAPTNLNVGPLTEDVLQLYRRKIDNKGIRVITKMEPEVRLTAVAGELRQVLSNLVSNAIDAMDAGGRLYVRVSLKPGSGGTEARITIADEGCGIPREAAARIFEPFFTTKVDVGTGLGLWVSRQILSKYGGVLRVRSAAGRGSVFTVSMPAAKAAAANV